ncbi:hypothetical protein KP509_1Z153900 [Ceratopteris richardii]|nr:hypothetical protein KP509_1Z153900 [Ceratopteris richardii]
MGQAITLKQRVSSWHLYLHGICGPVGHRFSCGFSARLTDHPWRKQLLCATTNKLHRAYYQLWKSTMTMVLQKLSFLSVVDGTFNWLRKSRLGTKKT